MQMLFLEFSMPPPMMRKILSMADFLAPIPKVPRVLKEEGPFLKAGWENTQGAY